MDVNDPLPNSGSHRSREIHGADDIVMGMKNIISPPSYRETQLSNERERLAERNGRLNDFRTKLPRTRIASSRFAERTIKRPVKLRVVCAGAAKYAEQPRLDCLIVEVLDDVQQPDRSNRAFVATRRAGQSLTDARSRRARAAPRSVARRKRRSLAVIVVSLSKSATFPRRPRSLSGGYTDGRNERRITLE